MRARLLGSLLLLLVTLPSLKSTASHWSDEVVKQAYAQPDFQPYTSSAAANISKMIEMLDQRNYAAPRDVILNGVSYVGVAARMRLFLKKLVAGEAVTVSAVGGSITARCGGGCDSYIVQLYKWIQNHFPNPGHMHRSGAVPGTSSPYLSACLEAHLESDPDLVIIELAVNDFHEADKWFTSTRRRAMERLIRKLLALPKKPVVLMLNMYAYCKLLPCGRFWINSERDYSEFALYYSLPSLSMKAGIFHRQDQAAAANDTQGFFSLPMFYDDSRIHPGMWGHYISAEMVIMLFHKVARDMQYGDLSDEEEERMAHAPIPKPMIAGNYEPTKSSCFVGLLFKDKIANMPGGIPTGWVWRDERGKTGYISERPGDVIKMEVDTRVATSVFGNETVLVQICFLQSYEHMGKAMLRCDSGCTCEPGVYNGHTRTHHSVTTMHNMIVSQHQHCVIVAEVSSESSSGEYKVKVVGVVVSEEAGETKGPLVNGFGAVDSTAFTQPPKPPRPPKEPRAPRVQ